MSATGQPAPDVGVVAITGGAGGVGLASARRFGQRHKIVLADRPAEQLDEAVETLRNEGLDVSGVGCDITVRDDVAGFAEATRTAGELVALISAAGLSPSMADEWRIVDVNLFGAIRVLDAFLPLARAGTAAVCIASISGLRRGMWQFDEILAEPFAPDFRARLVAEAAVEANPGRGYALSKRALQIHVEKAARAWGERGARIVSLSPGLIGDTAMGMLEAPKGASELVAASALGRAATADDIAAVCELLVSPLASYITGTDIRVDGGSIAGLVHNADPQIAHAWDYPEY